MGPVLAVALPPVALLLELLVAVLELLLVLTLKLVTVTLLRTLGSLLAAAFLPPTTCSSWSSVSSWIIMSSYIILFLQTKNFSVCKYLPIWLQGTMNILYYSQNVLAVET